MHSNIYQELRARIVLRNIFFLSMIVGVAFLAFTLNRIDERLGSLVSIDNEIIKIQSEVRDSNWIIACDDVPQVEAPQTFNHCNK